MLKYLYALKSFDLALALKNYGLTFFVTICASLTSLALYKISGSHFGIEGFALFSMVRRIIMFLFPLLACGMVVGIARESSKHFSSNKKHLAVSILKLSLLTELCFLAVLYVVFVCFGGFFSNLFFSSVKYEYILNSMTVWLLGNQVASIIYSYLRSQLRIFSFNFLYIFTATIFPLSSILFTSSLSSFFYLWGICNLLFSLVLVFFDFFEKNSGIRFDSVSIKFLSYSIKRVPGDICLQLLFVIPPIFLVGTNGLVDGAVLAFSISLLNMLVFPLKPLASILLPNFMYDLKNNSYDKVKLSLIRLSVVSLLFSVLIFVVVFIFSAMIIEYFSGVSGMSSVGLYVASISSFPFFIYFLLRNFLDAAHSRPYNSINCIISLAGFFVLFVLLSIFISKFYAIISALTASLYVLGGLTAYRTIFLVKNRVFLE